MPVSEQAEIPLSQLYREARSFLIESFKNHLDDILSSQLNPKPEGVPFIHFEGDPPQLFAIKKVINCLFHAEIGLKHWEGVNARTVRDAANAIPQALKSLYQVYELITVMDDATPEIRWVVTENYKTLAPLFSRAYGLINDAGWLPQFMGMRATDKASTVIGYGMDLLGADLDKWDNTNPLVSIFEKISKLMESVAGVQQERPGLARLQKIELIRSLLNELDNNVLLRQLTVTDFEDLKAVKDLLSWFKNIEEDGFDFTRKSIEEYLSWANYYLPRLIFFADQLERQNYLKSGLLSQTLCSSADFLGQHINKLLSSDSSFNLVQRVINTDSLNNTREQHIKSCQLKSVEIIMAAEKKQLAVIDFFNILQPYKGRWLSDVTEEDRVLLRVLYPKLQIALAHGNLELENKLTEILNTTGPQKTKDLPSRTRTWWQLPADGINYVASYIGSPEITKLLATKKFVTHFISTQIESEQFKIKIGERAREKLKPELEKVPLNHRVASRIDTLKAELALVPHPEVVPEKFIAVDALDLTDLKGTLTFFQKKQLSNTIHGTRTVIATLISKHFSEEDRRYFSTIPYKIKPAEPAKIVQIKKVENDLFALEKALKYFEQINLNYGVTLYFYTYLTIADAASKLTKSVSLLAPDALKILAPVLKEVMAYGSTLSGINYRNVDLTPIEQLTQVEVIPLDYLARDRPAREESLSLTEVPLSKDKRSFSKLDYIQKITTARISLLQKFKTKCSLPISNCLNPQKEGVPFLHIEDDAPQVAAIKKMINSMYYAESALRIWLDIDTSTTFAKIAAAHQGVVALSHVYKTLELFTEFTPEVQGLIRENQDLIKPVFAGAWELMQQEGWSKQFAALDVSQKLGSFFGTGIALVQPDKAAHSTQTASLVALLSELPSLLHNMTDLIDPDREVSVHQLRVSQERIDAISSLLELILEKKSPLRNFLKDPRAILGLIELNKKFQQQGGGLQEAAINAYQQWLEESYPDLLLILDELEVRYLRKPGTLSAPIVLEIDRINDKLNEVIDSKSNSKLKRINLSFDLAEKRKEGLKAKKMEYFMKILHFEEQMKSADTFFTVIKKYSGKPFNAIASLDRIELRRSFAMIQVAMANSNLDVANESVIALNQLETKEPESWKGVNVSIDQIIKQESLVKKYLHQRQRSCQLKIAVVDQALYYINSQALEWVAEASDDFSMDKLQKRYAVIQAKEPIVGPGELKPICSSSMHSIRGNLAYLQELKVSSVIAQVGEEFTKITRRNFSRHIQAYLTKPKDQHVHAVMDNEPLMVRQIKEIENGLYHVQTAFEHFEQIAKNDRLVSQARALVEIQHEAQQLIGVLEKLIPELKAHYGPLAMRLLSLSKKIQSIDYNKEDFNDLISIMQSTKKELLKRKSPQDPRLEKAFFEANKHQAPVQGNLQESAPRKAVRLGIKYMHLASPHLENAINHLHLRYKNVFEKHSGAIHSLSREQLADEELMHSEIRRLKLILERQTGFNVRTISMILDLIKQMQRVGIQASELTVMINQLVTGDFVQIKEKIYQELITKLSEEEDYLGLQPGILINPAMGSANQLFLSMALELEMPFDKKLSLLTDKLFLDIVITQTQKELDGLKRKLIFTYANDEAREIEFKIKIKEDKLAFLEHQVKILEDKDHNQTKRALLDIQFEVYLRDHLKHSNIRKPIANQYEMALRHHYNENKEHFLSSADSTKDLYQSIQIFERNNVGNYLIVSEVYRKLLNLSLKLPAENKELKDYIGVFNQDLIHDELSIEQRALKARFLPNDTFFVGKLSAADGGTHFLRKLQQLLQRVAASIMEGIRTGASICYIYNEKKIEDSIKNINRSIRLGNTVNEVEDLDSTGKIDALHEGEELDEIEVLVGIEEIVEDEEPETDMDADRPRHVGGR